ncbi:acyltransferase [Halobium palmae]|uniref:Acyltransferase n=1 Tax=Halobium palmae TaxID=1776492 RepID=A0ABD5RUA0_9EURY
MEDHVWIGTNVSLKKGVTVGEGSVIASNSIVTKDVSPHTLVAGVPAEPIKENISWEA